MKTVHLGRKIGGPESLLGVANTSPKPPAMSYPSLHLECDEKALKALSELPESGKMTVEYKITHKSANLSHGKKSGSLSLDIIRVLNAEGGKEKSGSESLDELAKEAAEGQDESD